MATEAAERRAVVRAQQMGAPLPPMEHQDPLPCPRCTSTNTKFCYYNNYNFSQPRHFCKSCRRYWTHGGTLRDIPVGGGTRKTAKRSRTSTSSVPSSTAATSTSSVGPILEPMPLNQAQPQAHPHTHTSIHTHHPVYVSGATPVGGGFTSLLSGGGGYNGGLLALGGFGLDEYGLGRGVWAFPNHEVGLSYVNNTTTNDSGGDVNGGSNNNSSGSNDVVGMGAGSGEEGGGSGSAGVSRNNDTWQVESGEVVGFVGVADCFASLPELAMSSSSPNLLK